MFNLIFDDLFGPPRETATSRHFGDSANIFYVFLARLMD